jgi:peroxiredoxin
MIQGIFGFQIKPSEFSSYGVGGFGVSAMSPEQFRRLLSRHKITVWHHAGDHSASISNSYGFAALNFSQKFREILGHVCDG